MKFKLPRLPKPRRATLAEMNAMRDKYRNMSKWKFVLTKGWTYIFQVAVFGGITVAVPGVWWIRLWFILFTVLAALNIGALPEKWVTWQVISFPTVEQAQRMHEAMKAMAADADDKFDQMMLHEATLQVERWLRGEYE